jgi:ATPase family protein associated with various cellular activities (AAA)
MTKKTRKNLFDGLQPTPAEHFKLFFYGAVLSLFHHVVQVYGSSEAAFKEFPFLIGYNNELADGGLAGVNSSEAVSWWLESLQTWESKATDHLPLQALRKAAGLDHSALVLLTTIGLIEEDLRFGLVFETMQGSPGQHRATPSLLNTWGRDEAHWRDARGNLRQLRELGLVRVVNPESPRLEWALEVPSALWDAMRGEQNEVPGPGLRYRPPAELAAMDDLVLPEEVHEKVRAIPGLFLSGEAQTLIERGAFRNGRRTVFGAIARELNLGLLEISGITSPHDERFRVAGPLATTLNALPVIVLDLEPRETVEIPRLTACASPAGIVLGKQGGVSGEGAEQALVINLDMPDPNLRKRHWQRACNETKLRDPNAVSERFRLTSGNIHRVARLAESYAALAKRTEITLADAQRATRSLNRQILDALAVRLPASGDWSQLAVGGETRRELKNLVSRCRHRERLQSQVGTKASAGVRALLSGPSGTGKTLAARLLGATLQMDVYRLDLSSVVNKYLGETEKNLNLILSRAEELDVILLVDEGDSLLTQRTGVQSSNDRWANLETNFLLQRLESFEGVLVVTTNASERIDNAFQRRMDVVISFSPPAPPERWAIWQLHLPPNHAVDFSLLEEVAGRCVLSGGQIKNAALHASLLALEDGGIVTSAMVGAAIEREYRKSGGVCPLRRN